MIKLFWIGVFLSVLLWSAINPYDRFTWFLEVAPAFIAFVVFAATYRKFQLTQLLYRLILFHCIILMIGGHYTYAEVPLFNDLKEIFNHQRNNFDKVGHFAQGFVPAIFIREIVIRKNIIPNPNWRVFFILSFCLAFSAFYELIEWWVAIATGDGAEAFLGTQGYIWDTQSDMAYALFGAIFSLLVLSKYHNKQLIQAGT